MASDSVSIKPCKTIETKDSDGKPNGWMLELVSDRDGFSEHLTGQMYLTVAAPGTLKGYHIHALATYHVTCIKGRMKSIIYTDHDHKTEVEMGEGDFKTVKYPAGAAHCIQNLGTEPAYILIYRFPSWSPDIPEQLDIAPERIETPEAWEEIRAFVKKLQADYR